MRKTEPAYNKLFVAYEGKALDSILCEARILQIDSLDKKYVEYVNSLSHVRSHLEQNKIIYDKYYSSFFKDIKKDTIYLLSIVSEEFKVFHFIYKKKEMHYYTLAMSPSWSQYSIIEQKLVSDKLDSTIYNMDTVMRKEDTLYFDTIVQSVKPFDNYRIRLYDSEKFYFLSKVYFEEKNMVVESLLSSYRISPNKK